MPKINQEEYEVLQFLNNTKDWIVRNPDGQLWAVEGEVPRKQPFYEMWKEGDGQDASKVDVSSFLFQFIQWEDEEPYEIAELIEEYESEETEVKDLQWMKDQLEKDYADGKRVQSRIKDGEKIEGIDSKSYWRGSQTANYIARCYLEDLDEPEVLSQKWISENVEYAYFDMLDGSGRLSSATAIIKPKKLQNLLVPKQPFGNSEELPKIPKFVADFLTGKEGYLVCDLLDYNFLYDVNDKVAKWLYDNDEETNKERELSLILAHYGEYTVEEEPKYVIDLDDEEFSDGNHYLKRLEMSVDGVKIIAGDTLSSMTFESKEEAQLIADYVGGRVKELEE